MATVHVSVNRCMNCNGELVTEEFYSETVLVCADCGEVAVDRSNNVTQDVTDLAGASTWVSSEGKGAKPQGRKWQGQRTGLAKKKGIETIEFLCSSFGISRSVKISMIKKFRKLYSANPVELAAAVFIILVRREMNAENAGQSVSLRHVANVLNVSIYSVAHKMNCVKSKLEKENQSSDPVVTFLDISQRVHATFSKCNFQDPFGWDSTNNRILQLTINILEFLEDISDRSYDPTQMTMAAGYIAWNSTFYFNSKYNSLDKGLGQVAPKERNDFERFFQESGLFFSRQEKAALQRHVKYVVAELSPQLRKLPWLRIKGTPTKRDIFQHIEELIDHRGIMQSLIQEEKRERTKNQPPVVSSEPVARIVFTPPANWNSEELCEKDLPEAEMDAYIRSAAEVKALERLMASSQSSSSDNQQTSGK